MTPRRPRDDLDDVGAVLSTLTLTRGRRFYHRWLPIAGMVLTPLLGLCFLGVGAQSGEYSYAAPFSMVGLALLVVWLLVVRVLSLTGRYWLALRVLVGEHGLALALPREEWVVRWDDLGGYWQVFLDGRLISPALPRDVLIFVGPDGETREVPPAVEFFESLRKRVRRELLKRVPEVLPVIASPAVRDAIMAARRAGSTRHPGLDAIQGDDADG